MKREYVFTTLHEKLDLLTFTHEQTHSHIYKSYVKVN